jgi:asparagine synthetase B (glutamine-hydrolysing)
VTGAVATSAEIRMHALLLEIRRSIAFREKATQDGALFYLSLLDDEIDDRFERLLALRVARPLLLVAPLPHEATAAAAELELTDAFVLCSPEQVIVARGGSCTFSLFWTRKRSDLHISTRLPLQQAKFSKAGLVSAVAAACLDGSYEQNACAETPLDGWQRLRRGVVTAFLGRSAPVEEIVVPGFDEREGEETEETVSKQIRAAFAGYARSQRSVVSSILELSGGFDSTLAGAGAQRPEGTLHGVSVEFPYYEFRLEAPLQRAVGEALEISRSVLDGTTMFPYAPPDRLPAFDEPTVFVTGVRHAEQVARLAATCAASRIYVGHGGDQLFSTDLTEAEPISHGLARAAFSQRGCRTVTHVFGRIRLPRWRQRSTGCFVYDARQDVWVKEAFGPTVRTPFTDLALFRAARAWSRLSVSQGAKPDKTILAAALPDLLPQAVVERHGKVAYDGVWMRAYAAHAEHIGRMLDRTSTVLEHIGLSPKWLLRRVRQLSNWQPVSGREVLAAYAISSWLVSQDIERASDVTWSG